ncbi:MAG: metallophosphoesterase [Terracidiphilus sp.]
MKEPVVHHMQYAPTSHLESLSRRFFLKTAFLGMGGLALYAGEIERHWLEVVHRDISIKGLSHAFEGVKIAQLSDIHMDEFTEPFLLREAINRINCERPDYVFLTGDYVTADVLSKKLIINAAGQCGRLLSSLECKQRYAIFGNHDVRAGELEVGNAMSEANLVFLRNTHVPLERNGGRLWLAGIDDPVNGMPDQGAAIPESIRHIPHEPVILMCHAPDYIDRLHAHPTGQTISLVLSGHTHGGQVRIPFVGPLFLPSWGRKYVEGLFNVGSMQLYVNRGIGSVGVPFRLDCRPEITIFTLRCA